jgi:hypothetical protein
MRYEFRPLVRWADPETERRRGAHLFKASWGDTLDLLAYEISCLDGVDPVVIQVDAPEGMIRRDGMLHARARVSHPGVIISFASRFGPLRYATDAYERQWSGGLDGWQANVRAIALALAALRAVDRYGVTKRGEQYTGWRAIAAPAPAFADAAAAERWMRTYAAELFGPAGARQWNGNLAALYRAMARRMHPDRGAPRAEWDRLDEARRVLAAGGVL